MSLLLNGALILGWGCSLALGLGTTITHDSIWLVLVIVLLRAQMQTGLFIVAHDAMHGLVCPERIKTNHAIGALALMAYAGVSYARCQRQHQRHHHQPGTADDPDFPADQPRSLLRWYGQFLFRYLSAKQLLRLLGGLALLVWLTATATSLAWRAAPDLRWNNLGAAKRCRSAFTNAAYKYTSSLDDSKSFASPDHVSTWILPSCAMTLSSRVVVVLGSQGAEVQPGQLRYHKTARGHSFGSCRTLASRCGNSSP